MFDRVHICCIINHLVLKCIVKMTGPTPNVDIVLSICLQSDLPAAHSGKIGVPARLPTGPAPCTSEISGSSKSHPMPSASSFKPTGRRHGKRKELDSMCTIHADQTYCHSSFENLIKYAILLEIILHKPHPWRLLRYF